MCWNALPYHWFSNTLFSRLRITNHFLKKREKTCNSLKESISGNRSVYIYFLKKIQYQVFLGCKFTKAWLILLALGLTLEFLEEESAYHSIQTCSMFTWRWGVINWNQMIFSSYSLFIWLPHFSQIWMGPGQQVYVWVAYMETLSFTFPNLLSSCHFSSIYWCI